jgi:uncharacterized protein YlaI
MEEFITAANSSYACKRGDYRYQHINKSSGKPVDTYLCKDCYEALRSNQESSAPRNPEWCNRKKRRNDDDDNDGTRTRKIKNVGLRLIVVASYQIVPIMVG